MKQSITILHLSDFHFGGENQDHAVKASKSFLYSLKSGAFFDQSREIDFVVITGDFTNKGDVDGFVKASEFLSELSALLKVRRENVIVCPGNHDLQLDVTGASWNPFISFYKNFYGKDATAKFDEIKAAEDSLSGRIGFVDVRVSRDPANVLFVAFNSAANMMKADDPGRIGKPQMNLVSKLAKDAGSDNAIAKIAVLHHHILPVLSESLPGMKEVYKHDRDVIRDSSEMMRFLIQNDFPLVLHGHFHKDFFAATTIPDASFNTRKNESSKRDLVIVGAGSVTCNPMSLHLQEEYYHFQIVTLNLSPSQYYEPRVIVEPFHYERGGWKKEGKIEYPVSISELHEKIFQKEKFFGDHDFLQADPWGLSPDEWFWDILSKTITGTEFDIEQKEEHFGLTEKKVEKHSLSPLVEGEKEKILELLVRNIKVYNRCRNFVFTATPAQLDGIYTFTSMFFTPKELNDYASREFQKSQWKDFIDLIQSRREDPVNWSHLDWANEIIAERVALHLKDEIEGGGLKEIFILEGGFGGLKTILALLYHLWEHSERIMKDQCLIRYRGIDIAHELVDHAKKVVDLARSETSLENSASLQDREIRKGFYDIFNRLNSFDKKTPLFQRGNLYDEIMDADFAVKYRKHVDVFIASYMMHHIYNSRRLVRSIHRRTFRKMLDVACGGDIHRYADRMCPQVLKEGCSAVRFIENVAADEKGIKAEWLQQNSRNLQSEIYRRTYDLLKVGGLICIADPNGFSKTFNRRIIFDQPNIAIASFSDVKGCLQDLFEAGFRNFEVWRQARLGDNTIVNLPYLGFSQKITTLGQILEKDFDLLKYNKDEEWPKIMSETLHTQGVAHPLEVEDQHLGYIIIGKKT